MFEYKELSRQGKTLENLLGNLYLVISTFAQGLFTEQIMPHCKMIKMEGGEDQPGWCVIGSEQFTDKYSPIRVFPQQLSSRQILSS